MSEIQRRIDRAKELLNGNVVRHETPTEILFAKPGTGDCHIRYTIIAERYLCVTGDLGDAVYEWNQPISFNWLAGLGLDYFAGKCRASEEGRGFQDWSPDECNAAFAFAWQSWVGQSNSPEDKELYKDATRNMETQHEWGAFCDANLRDIWPDLEGFWTMGMVVSLRCICHCIGLARIADQKQEARK